MVLFLLFMALASSGLAVGLWRLGTPTAKVLTLAWVFVLGQQLTSLPWLYPWVHGDIQLIFDNSARYFSLPMMIVACVAHHLNRRFGWAAWSAPAWGRIFFGLVAMFELGRRGDFNNHYSYLLYGLWLLTIAWTAFTRPAIKHYSRWLTYISLVCMAWFTFGLIHPALQPFGQILLPLSLLGMGIHYFWLFKLSIHTMHK